MKIVEITVRINPRGKHRVWSQAAARPLVICANIDRCLGTDTHDASVGTCHCEISQMWVADLLSRFDRTIYGLVKALVDFELHLLNGDGKIMKTFQLMFEFVVN